MKYTNLHAFEKHLAASFPHHLSSIYMILGKDSYERRLAIEAILRFLNKEKSREPLKSFEAGHQEISTILSELSSYSLFSSSQTILIQSIEKLSKVQQEGLEKYFKNPHSPHTLILSGETISSSTNFYKAGEQAGIILDIPEEKPWEKEKRLFDWAAEKIKREGKTGEAGVLEALIKQVGIDFTLLHQELEKLICYIGDRDRLTLEDISAVCVQTNQATGWQLGEAIFQNNPKLALSLVQSILEEGTPFISLLRQVRSQFQTECQISMILEGGGGGKEITLVFPYMKGNILERHKQTALQWGSQRLKKGICLIEDAELKAKNGFDNYELLADLLCIKLTTL